MGLDVKRIDFNIGTGAAGTTVTVTPGFQTKFAILFWSGRTETSSTTGLATHLRGMGFFTSAADFRCVTGRDGTGIGTSVTACGHRVDACIAEIDSADAFVGWADVQSINSTQVVFEILDQFVTSLRVTGWFVGGSDVAAESGVLTVPGSTGAQDVALSTLTAADIVFFLASPNITDAPAVVVDSTLSFGVGAGAFNSSAERDALLVYGGSNDASATGAAASYGMYRSAVTGTGQCIAMGVNPTNIPATSAEYNGSGGLLGANFQLNWTARSNSFRVHYLAVQGGRWALADLLTQTDTTTAIALSGIGFAPLGGLVVSHNKSEDIPGGTPFAHDTISIGAFTSASEQSCQATASRNGNTNMSVATAYEPAAVYSNIEIATATGARQGRMTVQSMDSDGVTFIMDDADPSRLWAGVVLVAANAVPGSSFPHHYYQQMRG